MKKQPFKNQLISLFRNLKIKIQSIGDNVIHVLSGVLKSCLITVDRSRLSISNLQQRTSTIKISLDFPVNYSIETFLYKLFKYHFINEVEYLKMCNQWQKTL